MKDMKNMKDSGIRRTPSFMPFMSFMVQIL